MVGQTPGSAHMTVCSCLPREGPKEMGFSAKILISTLIGRSAPTLIGCSFCLPFVGMDASSFLSKGENGNKEHPLDSILLDLPTTKSERLDIDAFLLVTAESTDVTPFSPLRETPYSERYKGIHPSSVVAVKATRSNATRHVLMPITCPNSPEIGTVSEP